MKRKIVTVAEDDLDDDKDPELRRILEESRLEAVARQVSKTKAMKTESGRVFPANTGPRISMQLDLIIRNPLEGGKREMTTVPLHAIRESKTISEILEMQDDAKLLYVFTKSVLQPMVNIDMFAHACACLIACLASAFALPCQTNSHAVGPSKRNRRNTLWSRSRGKSYCPHHSRGQTNVPFGVESYPSGAHHTTQRFLFGRQLCCLLGHAHAIVLVWKN